MADFLTFLRECAASGTLIGSICGLVVVPLLAWGAVRALTPYLLRMRGDIAWQAPIAAIAATLPGALFLSLGIVGLLGASSAGCLNFLWGRVLFGILLVLLSVALCRAGLALYRHAMQVRRLIARSQDAEPGVEVIAERCNVRVRVLNYSQPFCALARFWKPVVLLSRGTLNRLDDEELEAALRHESAHAIRLDLTLAALLRFFTELLPLPLGELIKTYNVAREIAADAHAALHCSRNALASAILTVVTKQSPTGETALAEDAHSVRQRVVQLLEARTEPPHPLRRRIGATASLAAIVFFSFLPVAISALSYHACTVRGMNA